MAAKPAPQITKAQLQKWVNLVNRLGGNVSKAATEVGVSDRTFRRHLDTCKKRGVIPPKKFDFKSLTKTTDVSDEELHEFWNVFERYGYQTNVVAEAMGVNETMVRNRIKKAQHKFGYEKKPLGVTHAAAAKKLALPEKGKVTRYMFSTAQNNTKLFDKGWAAGINLANYYEAEIKISTFTYVGSEGSEKRGKEKGDTLGRKVEDRWYDPRIEPYISDEFEEIAPGLVWCGHSNTLPTASDPLRGKQSLNGRSSGVWPHTRIEMRPIATAQGEATKFNWTTGAVTLRNYVQKNAGIVAEFYHSFGFMLVEVDSDGNWWARQLNSDSDGNIYDLDVLATPEGVFDWVPEKETEGGADALIYGDIHRSKIDPEVEAGTWGPGGLVDLLKPKVQVLHDLHNHNSSHHTRKDPHERYRQRRSGEDVMYDEIKGDGVWLDEIHRPYSREVIPDANHIRHADRTLKEVDWREDMTNARTILAMNLAWLDAIDAGDGDDFLAYEWAIRMMGHGKHAHFMNLTSEKPDKLSLIVCKGNGGGIEIGAHHGDRGPNGSRGTPANLSKMGRKVVIGDKHSPGIWGGCYVAGMTGKMRQGYNIGPGSWAAAHIPVYPNGKRQVLIGWKGRFFAPRG